MQIRIGSTENSCPYGILEITETATSTANNTSTLAIKLVLKRPASITDTATKTASCTVNGTTWTFTGAINGSGDKTLINKTLTVKHDADGTKTVSASAAIGLNLTWQGAQLGTVQNSGYMQLTALEVRAVLSHSLAAKTETTATIAWTADAVIDYLWYSTDDGTTWNGVQIAQGTSGSYTISGLLQNKSYKVRTRVHRADNWLSTTSNALTVKTYAYPYASKMPDFTIGNKLTVGLFNPLGRSVTVGLYDVNGYLISTVQTSGTSVSGWNGSADVEKLLQSIPNTSSGTYTVRVTYGANRAIRTGGTYTAGSSAKPTIGSAEYADTNPVTVAITQNNQKIIQNRSAVRFDVSGLAASAGATVSSCVLTVNDTEYPLTISGSSAAITGVLIDSSSNVDAVITVTDSRGLQGTKTLRVTMLDYTQPSAICQIERDSNYYTATNINVNAEYSDLDGANAVVIKARYKKTTASTWGSWITLTDEVTTTVQLDNAFSWNVQITVTDVFSTTTYNAVVPRGMPIVFFDSKKHSTGFNCFPQHENSVEINGADVYAAMFHQPGDTLTLTNNVPISGLCTSGNDTIYLQVPAGKSLRLISGIAVNNCLGGIRPPGGGYVNSGSDSDEWTSMTGITVSATKASEHLIQLKIENTTTFTNISNNMPCSMLVKNLTLSFT